MDSVRRNRGITGHERNCLIVAEPGKQRIFARKIVVQANIEFAFVEFPHRHVRIVKSIRECRTGTRVQVHQRLSNWVDHCGRNVVAMVESTPTACPPWAFTGSDLDTAWQFRYLEHT